MKVNIPLGHVLVTSDPNIIIVRELYNCITYFVNCEHLPEMWSCICNRPKCILNISDVKHQFGQWLSAHVYFL